MSNRSLCGTLRPSNALLKTSCGRPEDHQVKRTYSQQTAAAYRDTCRGWFSPSNSFPGAYFIGRRPQHAYPIWQTGQTHFRPLREPPPPRRQNPNASVVAPAVTARERHLGSKLRRYEPSAGSRNREQCTGNALPICSVPRRPPPARHPAETRTTPTCRFAPRPEGVLGAPGDARAEKGSETRGTRGWGVGTLFPQRLHLHQRDLGSPCQVWYTSLPSLLMPVSFWRLVCHVRRC